MVTANRRARLERFTPVSGTDLLARLAADCPDDHVTVAVVSLDQAGSEAEIAQALGLKDGTLADAINVYADFSAAFRRQGPRLIRLSSNELQTVGRAMRDGREVTVLCLAAEAMQLLALHLKRLVRQTQPDGGRLLFRFQDRLVLSNLLPLLREDQLLSLLGPAHSWAVMDACGTLHVASRMQPNAAVKFGELGLDAAQLETLSRELHPGTVILQADEVDSTLLAGRSRCEQWQLVRERSGRARERGLLTDEDVALYVVLSLQLPDLFDRSGPIAEALDRSRAQRTSFGDEVDAIESEEWEQ